MVIEFIILLLIAYLLGSVPAAYLATRWSRGIDIRQYGSGNVGASNVLRFTSKRVGIPVIVFDIGKGMAAVWAAQFVGLGSLQQVLIGLAVISGHNWPVFLRFKGGRGILTTLGVILMLAPWLALIMAIIAFSFAPFHQLAPGVLLAMLSAPVLAWFLSPPLVSADRTPVTLGLVAMSLIVAFRRLAVPRSSLASSVTRGELFFNRLLFDRDIRNREPWINHILPEADQPAGQKDRIE
ncbi:glycerol-3-phosphate 1-O-acyltransferase PlsY [Chloroflexota bacterium]